VIVSVLTSVIGEATGIAYQISPGVHGIMGWWSLPLDKAHETKTSSNQGNQSSLLHKCLAIEIV
jgi:hypothetical protein